ncbi:MAG: TetR/AcrR family transcriptional regulator [Anaerolineales bacterium]|nr:TetR/AcrR family transcriptional regulator [Anaerolineales bacterium]
MTEENQDQAPDETRERILQAAEELFMEHGYVRSTTRAIAEAAGVNEVTLFRHFGSKRNLMQALVQTHSAIPDFIELVEKRLGDDYRHDLTVLGAAFYQALTERRNALRLMLCEAEEVPEVREIMAQIPGQLRQLTTRYIQKHIDAGMVRDLGAEYMAQAFLGMFFAYIVGSSMLDAPAVPDATPEDLTTVFVDIFIQGTLAKL